VHLQEKRPVGTGLQRLDGDVMARIMAKGFSRVPVFSGDTHNIQGRQAGHLGADRFRVTDLGIRRSVV
jgi:hypothetical protein